MALVKMKDLLLRAQKENKGWSIQCRKYGDGKRCDQGSRRT